MEEFWETAKRGEKNDLRGKSAEAGKGR
jgi:hypothetical protein